MKDKLGSNYIVFHDCMVNLHNIMGARSLGVVGNTEHTEILTYDGHRLETATAFKTVVDSLRISWGAE